MSKTKPKDYEEIVNKLTSDNENNRKFDEKYNEFKVFISRNFKKKHATIRGELYARLEEMKSISKHRVTNLFLDKSLFWFVYEQKATMTGIRFANFLTVAIRKTLGGKRINRKKNAGLSRMIEEARNQNKLIRKLDYYIVMNIDDNNLHKQYYDLIKKFEQFLMQSPLLNELIDKALSEEDSRNSKRIWELYEENEQDILHIFTKKEYERTLEIVEKNPNLYYLLFNYWNDIAFQNNLYYLAGKRAGKPNDSKIIKWILNLTGREYVSYKSKEFKKIQKRWNTFKNKTK